jgi:hypothetical protein
MYVNEITININSPSSSVCSQSKKAMTMSVNSMENLVFKKDHDYQDAKKIKGNTIPTTAFKGPRTFDE